MTQPLTADSLDLEQIEHFIEDFIGRHYDAADDPQLVRVWAWSCFAEYTRDNAVGAMATAVDRGFTLLQVGDSIGVSRQAIGQRLLRSKPDALKRTAPARPHGMKPLF